MISNKIIRGLLLISVISFFVYIIYSYVDFTSSLKFDQETRTENALPVYNNLFDKDAQSQLQILSTVESKYHQPESSYLYSKEFNLWVYRSVLDRNVVLKNIININTGSSDINNGELYSLVTGYNFEVQRKLGKADPVSIINLVYNGDSIRTISKNDSVTCYYLNVHNFSFSYNQSTKAYFLYTKSSNSINYPIELAFLKKGGFIYTVMMSPIQGNNELKPDLLYSILGR